MHGEEGTKTEPPGCIDSQGAWSPGLGNTESKPRDRIHTAVKVSRVAKGWTHTGRAPLHRTVLRSDHQMAAEATFFRSARARHTEERLPRGRTRGQQRNHDGTRMRPPPAPLGRHRVQRAQWRRLPSHSRCLCEAPRAVVRNRFPSNIFVLNKVPIPQL